MASPPSEPSSPLGSSRLVPTHQRATPKTDPSSENAPIPDEEQSADLPLTMSASVVLTSLPRDAHQALTDVEAIDSGKSKSPCKYHQN